MTDTTNKDPHAELMALAFRLRDARTYEWDVSEVTDAQKAIDTYVRTMTARIAELEISAKYAEHIDATPENQLQTMLHDALTERDGLRAQLESIGAGGVSMMPKPLQIADRSALVDLMAEHLSGTYHCTRTWGAWHVGTMSQDDFEDVGESDTPGELVDAILAILAVEPQQIAEPASEPLLRFCPGCGRVGDVPKGFRDCCPDGSDSRVIPASLANKCHDLFQLAIKAAPKVNHE